MELKTRLNDDKTLKGIEAWYYPDLKHLHIDPTNCNHDWKMNILGYLPLLVTNWIWWREVIALYKICKQYEISSLSGHSKGGTQAFYFRLIYLFTGQFKKWWNTRVIAFAAFPPWPLLPIRGILHKKRGDIFPLFSQIRYTRKVITGDWQPVTKSHNWSTSEIEGVICASSDSF